VNIWVLLKWFLPLAGFLFLLAISSCENGFKDDATFVHSTGFLNLHDSVKYVGMNTCKQCHSNIHETFQHTGMGQSFDKASKQKSVAHFQNHKPVYDSRFDYYYYPFWAGEVLMLKEFRLLGKDTIHKRTQRIDYIIGSGQHTNSHLYSVNGFVFQAPITWYAQEGKWDLPPGFEEGAKTRFSRIISLECMSCHNAFPEFVSGSENKFNKVLQGIDCERCHGPGSLHVQEKMAGKIVDTSRYTDYTIVNPRKLPVELQMEICQRCHLQGNSVLKPGKSFFDFRPGMKLSEVFDVFMPKYEGDNNSFIMASHVERLKMSKCYQAGANSFNCISCHNPHVSVKVTGSKIFNQTCTPCHNLPGQKECSENMDARKSVSDDCVKCHMPASGPIDIPHVTTHDHYIRKPVASNRIIQAKEFAGLICLTDSNPESITRAQAYLNYYEKFEAKSIYLDSANFHLKKSTQNVRVLQSQIHLAYLKQDFAAIRNLESQLAQSDSARSDAWTCYRMGEAFQQKGTADAIVSARKWYIFAVRQLPYNPEFRNKLGASYLSGKLYPQAELWFKNILRDLPDFVPALNNLGYLYMLLNKSDLAHKLLQKAIMLDPDYELAIINLISWNLRFGTKQEARKMALQLISKFPGNPEYQKLYKSCF